MREPSTAEILPVAVMIHGQAFYWTEGRGLDPLAINTLQGWLINTARRYLPLAERKGLALDDLIQEGRVAALMAARRFDPSRGVKFISYASRWITSRIVDVVNRDIVHSSARVRRRLIKETGASFEAMSLDEPTAGGEQCFADMLIDEDGQKGHQAAERSLALTDCAKVLGDSWAVLDRRERAILNHHFGLAASPETLDEIGARLGLSRERIRQIECKALRKLRRQMERRGIKRSF